MSNEVGQKIGLKQNGKFYYGWLLVFVGFLLMVFAYTGFISITSLFVIPVTKAFGIDRAPFMFYQTILCLASVFVSAYYGKRMMKNNIKRIMVAAILCAVIGYVIFANAQNIYWFFAGSILLGVGFSNCTVLPISIILNNWFGEELKGKVMGFAFAGSGVGGFVLLPALNAVIQNYGWRIGYYVLAGIFLVLMIIAFFTIVKTPEEKNFVKMGQAAGEKHISEATGLIIKEAFKTPMFWFISATVLLTVLGSSAILGNSVPYFVEVGFSYDKAALFASFNVALLTVGKFLIGFLSDRFGTRFGAVFSAVVFSLGFVFLAILPANPNIFVFGCIICFGVGGGGITVCPPLMVNSLFGEKDYGNIVASMNMATNLGGAFGGIVAAMFFDLTKSYVKFWWVMAVIMLIVVILRIISFEMRKKYTY